MFIMAANLLGQKHVFLVHIYYPDMKRGSKQAR